MLRTARTTVASLVTTQSALVDPQIPAHLKHLRDLAIGDAKSSADAVVENFRVAAMHLSYILSLPAAQAGQVLADLPDLPKEWSHLTSLVPVNAPLTHAEQLSIIGFTKSSDATTSKLRAVLHSALMVSPIYLLVPSSLRKCKSFSRETLFRVRPQYITIYYVANHECRLQQLLGIKSPRRSGCLRTRFGRYCAMSCSGMLI